MFSPEKRAEIVAFFEGHIQGGVAESNAAIFDQLIEEGILTEVEFAFAEMEVCEIFDDGWFTCNDCSWTVTSAQRSWNRDDICEDCDDETD